MFALKSPGFRCTGSSPCGSPELRCEVLPSATTAKARANVPARATARAAPRQRFVAFPLVLLPALNATIDFTVPSRAARPSNRRYLPRATRTNE